MTPDGTWLGWNAGLFALFLARDFFRIFLMHSLGMRDTAIKTFGRSYNPWMLSFLFGMTPPILYH